MRLQLTLGRLGRMFNCQTLLILHSPGDPLICWGCRCGEVFSVVHSPLAALGLVDLQPDAKHCHVSIFHYPHRKSSRNASTEVERLIPSMTKKTSQRLRRACEVGCWKRGQASRRHGISDGSTRLAPGEFAVWFDGVDTRIIAYKTLSRSQKSSDIGWFSAFISTRPEISAILFAASTDYNLVSLRSRNGYWQRRSHRGSLQGAMHQSARWTLFSRSDFVSGRHRSCLRVISKFRIGRSIGLGPTCPMPRVPD